MFIFIFPAIVFGQNDYIQSQFLIQQQVVQSPFFDEGDREMQVQVLCLKQCNKLKINWFIAKPNSLQIIYDGTLQSLEEKHIISIPLNDTFIKSGNYELCFAVYNQSDSLLEMHRNYFQTFRKENDFYREKDSTATLIQDNNFIDLEKTFVWKYDISQLKKNIAALQPISDRAEFSVAQSILLQNNVELLKRYFYNFWLKRNIHEPEAEWKKYVDKLNMVAQKYGTQSYPGYSSDRGKLILKFGEPSYKLTANNEQGTHPYEVWFYRKLDQFSNIALLFVQVSAISNDRVLVHSSKEGFLDNPAWKNILFNDSNEMFNTSAHKVYEYFK